AGLLPREHPALEPREHPGLEPKSIGMDSPPQKAAAKSSPTAELPLLRTGTILRLEIGKEALAQRSLDLAEDLFAAQHMVGGQVISRVDPNQHGLPVLPMTFSMEIMAEIASLLMPGLVVIGIRNIRLFRSLNYDEDEPRTMEVAANVLPEAAPQSEA